VYVGRLLTSNEEVDHRNNIWDDDRLDNYQILTLKQHKDKIAKYKGKLMVEYECPICSTIFTKRFGCSHYIQHNKSKTCSKSCSYVINMKHMKNHPNPIIELRRYVFHTIKYWY
jgi:hypothetical protein